MPPDASDSPAPGGAPHGPPLWLVVLSAAIPVSLIAAWFVAKEKKMAKRKRGLSGTPEHHAIQSGLNYEEALREYERADSEAKSGKCKWAFRTILGARHAEGEAWAHMNEAGSLEAFSDSWHGSAMEPEAKARASAWKSFEANCLAPGLSGLRRRKARR